MVLSHCMHTFFIETTPIMLPPLYSVHICQFNPKYSSLFHLHLCYYLFFTFQTYKMIFKTITYVVLK